MYFQKNFCVNQLKNSYRKFVDSIIMFKFGKTKVAKEEFYSAKKQ